MGQSSKELRRSLKDKHGPVEISILRRELRRWRCGPRCGSYLVAVCSSKEVRRLLEDKPFHELCGVRLVANRDLKRRDMKDVAD